MQNTYWVPIDELDDYLLKTFDHPRYLRSFNNHLRGNSFPVGDFHPALHDDVLYDLDKKCTKSISLVANKYVSREHNYKACVLEVQQEPLTNGWKALLQWTDSSPVPDKIRVTAILRGKRVVRVVQFGAVYAK